MTGGRRGSCGRSPPISRGDHQGDHVGGDASGHVDPRNGRSPKSCRECLRREEKQRNIVTVELTNTYVHVYITLSIEGLLFVCVHQACVIGAAWLVRIAIVH